MLHTFGEIRCFKLTPQPITVLQWLVTKPQYEIVYSAIHKSSWSLAMCTHLYPCMHMQSYRRHVHNLPYRRPYIHTQPTMYTAGKPTNCTNITLCMKRGNCKNVFLVRTIILIFTHALELSRAGFNPWLYWIHGPQATNWAVLLG